jgi:hypothetical protein
MLSKEQLDSLSIDNKWKIYFEYLWCQLKLIHVDLEIDIHKHTQKENLNLRKYPNLLPNKYQVKSGFMKKNIKSFESFCNEKNDLVSEGIYGTYYRMENKEKIMENKEKRVKPRTTSRGRR